MRTGLRRTWDDHPPADALRSLAGHLRRARFDAGQAAGLPGAPSAEQVLSNPARYAFFADPTRVDPARSPATVLTWLFVLNRRVPAQWLQAGLDPEFVALLRELNLLVPADREGGEYHATVSITPYRSRFFLSDQLFVSPAPQRIVPNAGPRLVMPPHASSLIALAAVDRIGDAFLDVGCGSGFLAIGAAARGGRVAGIDANPRCVRLATVNSLLNGVEAHFRVADVASFAPPAADRFGSLLFNTPTLPRARAAGDSEFGQTTADHVIRSMVGAARRILRPGGTAYVQALVEVPARFATAADAVRDWLSDQAVRDISVTEIDAPHLTVTREQLRRGRLPGQSLLAYGAAEAGDLVAALVARGVAAVALVLVGIRI
jgi:SAM-dependent methyltransferase